MKARLIFFLVLAFSSLVSIGLLVATLTKDVKPYEPKPATVNTPLGLTAPRDDKSETIPAVISPNCYKTDFVSPKIHRLERDGLLLGEEEIGHEGSSGFTLVCGTSRSVVLPLDGWVYYGSGMYEQHQAEQELRDKKLKETIEETERMKKQVEYEGCLGVIRLSGEPTHVCDKFL